MKLIRVLFSVSNSFLVDYPEELDRLEYENAGLFSF